MGSNEAEASHENEITSEFTGPADENLADSELYENGMSYDEANKSFNKQMRKVIVMQFVSVGMFASCSFIGVIGLICGGWAQPLPDLWMILFSFMFYGSCSLDFIISLTYPSPEVMLITAVGSRCSSPEAPSQGAASSQSILQEHHATPESERAHKMHTWHLREGVARLIVAIFGWFSLVFGKLWPYLSKSQQGPLQEGFPAVSSLVSDLSYFFVVYMAFKEYRFVRGVSFTNPFTKEVVKLKTVWFMVPWGLLIGAFFLFSMDLTYLLDHNNLFTAADQPTHISISVTV